MNKSVYALGLLLAVAGAVQAQVTVEVVFEQDQFLRNESLPIKVRLNNSSGRSLQLGRESDWLTFEIQDHQGHSVRRLAEVPLTGPFVLESAKAANLQTDLMPYFDLNDVGHFTVTVSARIPQLGETYTSKPRPFDITSGTTLWEREFGLPGAGVPEVRKYALQQANSMKHLRLYARLTDRAENKIFRVVPLGSLVSFSKPEAQLDKSSNLHVLFQTGARNFLYQIITAEGELIIRQTYAYADNRPTLRTREEGVYVAGGRRLIMRSDLPPPPEEAPLPPPQETPSTNEPTKTPPKNK